MDRRDAAKVDPQVMESALLFSTRVPNMGSSTELPFYFHRRAKISTLIIMEK
jgi:hypothetical protein